MYYAMFLLLAGGLSLVPSVPSASANVLVQTLNEACRDALEKQDYSTAQKVCPEAVAEAEKGARNTLFYAVALHNLAQLYYHQRQYAKAEPLYQQSLAIQKRERGAEHPNVAADLTGLAELYRAKGEYAKAEPLFKQALTIDEHALGAKHPTFHRIKW